MKELYRQIAACGRECGASRIVLFGSRARSDHRPRSDIDLAVYGLPADRQAGFRDMLDGLHTLLDFDVVFVSDATDPALIRNIEKDGVLLMDKTAEKLDRLTRAAQRLTEAIAAYDDQPVDVIRDGAIQRFEFCTELAWKTTREYLIDQGYTELNSPKSVMKQAFADGLISDGWLELLEDRNRTSHLYDDATAAVIFDRIRAKHVPLFRALIAALAKK